MGHDLSKPSNRLAIAAVSHITQFDQDDLKKLRTFFQDQTDSRITNTKPYKLWNEANVSRSTFNEGLEDVCMHTSDREIMARIFTMLDKTGDESINYQEFLIGISPLVSGDIQHKFFTAFELFDEKSSGDISRDGLFFVLSTMNMVSSYFGDTPIDKKDIQKVVEDLFAKKSQKYATISYVQGGTKEVTNHKNIIKFLNQASDEANITN